MGIYSSSLRQIDDALGKPCVVRIFRSEKNLSYEEVCADVYFLIKSLGRFKLVSQMRNESSSCMCANFLMIHENEGISYLTLNAWTIDVAPMFKLDVSCQNGLIEYDSEKYQPLRGNVPGLDFYCSNISDTELSFDDDIKNIARSCYDFLKGGVENA